MTARADLHVHSKASNRPTEWLLRQFGAPESFTEPREVYRLCRERGMDFVTLSDHDTVAGALEIAHLPGTFLSEEVTVEFPEDGCQIHCLAIGITEAQHRDIQELRKNVYELRDYFLAHDILHSVAHPLFRVNDMLTLAQVEKLLVLFNRFEGLNGIHDRRANALVRRIFGSLGLRKRAYSALFRDDVKDWSAIADFCEWLTEAGRETEQRTMAWAHAMGWKF